MRTNKYGVRRLKGAKLKGRWVPVVSGGYSKRSWLLA